MAFQPHQTVGPSDTLPGHLPPHRLHDSQQLGGELARQRVQASPVEAEEMLGEIGREARELVEWLTAKTGSLEAARAQNLHLLEDMSGLREATDIYAVSDTSTALICKQPEASVLLLTDVTGARYNPAIVNRLKENTKLTTPHMKAYVVVGITGLMRVVLQSVVMFTGQDIKMCRSIEEAKEWLVQQ